MRIWQKRKQERENDSLAVTHGLQWKRILSDNVKCLRLLFCLIRYLSLWEARRIAKSPILSKWINCINKPEGSSGFVASKALARSIQRSKQFARLLTASTILVISSAVYRYSKCQSDSLQSQDGHSVWSMHHIFSVKSKPRLPVYNSLLLFTIQYI